MCNLRRKYEHLFANYPEQRRTYLQDVTLFMQNQTIGAHRFLSELMDFFVRLAEASKPIGQTSWLKAKLLSCNLEQATLVKCSNLNLAIVDISSTSSSISNLQVVSLRKKQTLVPLMLSLPTSFLSVSTLRLGSFQSFLSYVTIN